MNNVNVLIKGCNCIAVFNILNDKNLIFNHLFITIYLNANQQYFKRYLNGSEYLRVGAAVCTVGTK